MKSDDFTDEQRRWLAQLAKHQLIPLDRLALKLDGKLYNNDDFWKILNRTREMMRQFQAECDWLNRPKWQRSNERQK